MSIKHRKKYSHEFKIEAVRQTYESGKTVSQVARELDINVPLLSKWRDRLTPKNGESPPRVSRKGPASELEKLRRENARLKEERDILKKAAAFFAKESIRDINSLKNTDESSEFE